MPSMIEYQKIIYDESVADIYLFPMTAVYYPRAVWGQAAPDYASDRLSANFAVDQDSGADFIVVGGNTVYFANTNKTVTPYDADYMRRYTLEFPSDVFAYIKAKHIADLAEYQ